MAFDPNAPVVQASRASALDAARGDLLDDREAYLCELARGRDVLDLGCVNHDAASRKSSKWLHGRLREVAGSLVGTDILEDELAVLRGEGYEVRVLDITKESLPQTFDLVVAGELVEHVGDVGLMFEHVRQMLRPGGRFVLTTPNPWFLNPVLKMMRKGPWFVESVEHTAWHEPSTLSEMAARAGLRLERFCGLRVTETNGWLSGSIFRFWRLWVLLGFRPELFAKSLLMEFTLA